jgi:hypothetical protein
LYRAYWATLDADSLWIFLFADASPQFRGRELFAATFDMYIFGETMFFRRRKFTQIAVSRNMLTLLGKVTALLWQIFLQVGPHYEGIRRFCDRVGGVTTDMGVEKDIADYRDVLIPFLHHLGVRIPRSAITQEHLFPNALMTVGWFHLWDGVLRHGLCNLVWFAFFLKVLKAIAKFVRNEKEELMSLFRKADLDGSAALLRVTSVPTFAEWRWGKLGSICQRLKATLSVLRAHVHVVNPLLHKMRETSLAALVKIALTSEQWYTEFKFTDWFSDLL